ncbi:TRAP transporter small permease [Ramlibacter tataouinensis]|uniref:TRAP transporter small permease n=1 Tax=Ramlibacter tataouinensis TaxID=94132 RepID=UPI0022F3FB6B|nr:TRAP transporter small permease [Ramlibacter tataouinensis]WBY02954.1 TRAP transporter small permease [Ramlibacter tataouinensis]
MVTALVDWICRLFSLLMVACLAAMVAMVFGNVVLRYGFNSGITVSEELSRWLFVWMTFLGSFVALRSHRHLGTNALTMRLGPAARKACFGASRVLMLGVCWLVAQGGWKQTLLNRQTTSAVTEAPMSLFYASSVLFAVLAGLVLLHELWRLVRGRLSPADLVGVGEEDDAPHSTSFEAPK